MQSKSGGKAYFLFIAKMFQLDQEDKLVLEDHAFNTNAICITHSVTHRAFTVVRRSYGCEFDYINAHGNVTEQIIDDPLIAARRAMSFLKGKSDRI